MKQISAALIAIVGAVSWFSPAIPATPGQGEIVFQDDFSSLKVEMLSAGVVGAEAEYHYVPKIAPQGNWEVSCFRSDASQRAWRVLREEGFGRKFLYQASTSSLEESTYTHPIVVAGDPLWTNYILKDRNSEAGCLTAMTFDSKILWQSGEPDAWRDRLTCDVAVQVHDMDHDGKNEVVYCRDMELVIAEGATGRVKRKIKTPFSPPAKSKGEPHNKYERILGDALYFLDLRGQGWAGDLILKDRYSHFWAFTDKLEPLWDVACNTGHYGYAYDIDGDGKDEFAIGYTLLDHDGKILWTLDDKLKDHADAVAILKLHPEDPEPVLFCAASD